MEAKNKAKRTKKSNGEGHIYYDKDKKYWFAQLTRGYGPNGKQLYKYFGAKTKQEILRKRDEFKALQRKGVCIESSKMTVSSWLDYWYENHVIDKVKTTTRVDYETSLRCHLKPNLGNIKLIELKGMHVQQLYNQLQKTGRVDGKGGLSPKSIRNIHIVFHRALEQAITNDLIVKNPLRGVTLPKKESKPIVVLAQDEQKRLEGHCFEHPWGVAILLTLYSGMRLGEVLGLTWKDIDFEKNCISINKQVGRLKDFSPEAKQKTKLYLRNETKTSSSNRTIATTPEIMKELTKHKDSQEKQRRKWGAAYNNLNMAFCREDGNLVDPKTFRTFYLNTLKKAGVEHKTFHALRHTFATRAMEVNSHVKAVSSILGHAGIQITLDTYSHVSQELQQETMQKIVDNFFAC